VIELWDERPDPRERDAACGSQAGDRAAVRRNSDAPARVGAEGAPVTAAQQRLRPESRQDGPDEKVKHPNPQPNRAVVKGESSRLSITKPEDGNFAPYSDSGCSIAGHQAPFEAGRFDYKRSKSVHRRRCTRAVGRKK
jgi:hypothetical protein